MNRFDALRGQVPKEVLDYMIGETSGVIEEGAVSTVRGITHFYADATNGNDSNDGLSWDTAKKTIDAMSSVFPDCFSDNSVIHLRGEFNLNPAGTISQPTWSFRSSAPTSVFIVIDGGDEVTIIDDNSGSNYTATGASTTSLVVASAPWVAEAHSGYWVQVLSGPATGETRTIKKITTTTITPSEAWSISPGIGATFRIVRPATVVTSTNNAIWWIFGEDRSLYLCLQRMTFTGTKWAPISQGQAMLRYLALVCENKIYSDPYYALRI